MKNDAKRNKQDAAVLGAIKAAQKSGKAWVTHSIAVDTDLESTQVTRAIARLLAAGKLRARTPQAALEAVEP